MVGKSTSICNSYCIKMFCNVNFKFVYRQFSRQSKIKSPSFNYCLDIVKTRDYENFLCTLLLPQNLRAYGIILRAFNVEIASVQDQVSNKLAGEMRYTFWENAIDDLYKGLPPEHPVCLQLSKIISKKQLSKMYMKRLIVARRSNLQSPIFPTLESAENYGEQTISTLYYLLLQVAGIKNIHVDHAASHLGRAQSVINLLRGVLYFAKHNSVKLPQDILLKHGVSQECILRGKCDKNVKDAIFEIASRAHLHLEKMESIKKNINKEYKIIYLPSVPAKVYLKKLLSVDFDVFNPKLNKKNGWLPLQLYWKKHFL